LTPDEFSALADRWFADVKPEAVRLFADGVPHDRCLKLAIAISDAKAEATMRRRLAEPSPLLVPRRN
jgi:hypothetical protein